MVVMTAMGCSGSGPGASGSFPPGQPGDYLSQFPSGFHTVQGLVWQIYLLELISLGNFQKFENH